MSKTSAKSKKPKGPLTRCDGTMTESAWLAWIRSALRSKSLRWPPRANALKAAQKPYKGPNKQRKYSYECAICKELFPLSNTHVDHFPVPAGSILTVEDISSFCGALFCDSTNLRVLCKPCHKIHTLSESKNISFEQASIEKRIIEICKKPAKELLTWLDEQGYNGSTVSNAAKRRAIVAKILKGE